MEVHGAAGLGFGDLDVADADEAAGFPFAFPDQVGHAPVGQVDGAFPQSGGVPVPHDQAGGVVAVGADRGAQKRVVVGVDEVAAAGPAVWAAAGVGPADLGGAVVGAAGVHRAEAGCGDGDEQARVGGDRFGDVQAAGDAGVDDLPGVPGVEVGAGRAGGGPPVPAGNENRSVRQGRGIHDAADFTGGPVGLVNCSGQADWVGAAAGALYLHPQVDECAGGEAGRGRGKDVGKHGLRSLLGQEMAARQGFPPAPRAGRGGNGEGGDREESFKCLMAACAREAANAYTHASGRPEGQSLVFGGPNRANDGTVCAVPDLWTTIGQL